jgi:hypothetical protein
MSDLDVAMRKHMEYIVFSDCRPFSFRDFLQFEVDGKEYCMAIGTVRNKISTLRKSGEIEFEYNSGTAFYTLKGHRFGKPMTPNHTGVNNSKMDSFSRLIYNLPTRTPAAHNIRLRFQVRGIWAKLSSVQPVIPVNQRSKDISIPTRPIGGLVHHSDTVSVIVACSIAPVAVNFNGWVELSNALTRVHEMLNVILNDIDYCSSDQSFSNDSGFKNSSGNDLLIIPDPKHWVITMWHIGVDSLTEYSKKEFHITVEDAQHVIIRAYNKTMKNNKTIIRLERQEYPRKTLQAAVEEKISLGGR